MKVAGLITEYNPFHTGHLFHIEQAKRLSGADYILVIMSGDFVQRGTPAILDKYARAEMALLCGADAVIELPVRFACASAEFFACGAVFLLEQLGITDFLCFGSECGNLKELQTAARLLSEESDSFQKKIREHLKQGESYPSARMKAFSSEFSRQFSEEAPYKLLSEPNNILGLEYLKALKRIKSQMTPLTFKRQEAGYHDEDFCRNFASATALRKELLTNGLQNVKAYIPQAAFPVLEREYLRSFPILAGDFSLSLYYKIRSDMEKGVPLCAYQDISPDLEARIFHELNHFTSFDEFAAALKTRQYTLTRINRCLLHILLDIKKPALSLTETCMPSYARLLGFCKSSSALLTAIKAHSAIPLITKMADAKKILSESAYAALAQDIFSADLYRKVQELKFHTVFTNEFTHPLILVS